ncbi:MAG: hypothetical protein ABJA02_02680 [Acidobacteriota bacterium]
MNSQLASGSHLSLTPLGAGDLIDRAVRFYRKNFWTLITIAAPPVFVGTLFSVGWMFLGRTLFSAQAAPDSSERVIYYLFQGSGSVLILMIEMIATLVVMGGASRNFVRHLLFGEPITFRETYRNTAKRVGSLVVSSTIIVLLLGFIGFVLFYFGLIVGALLIMLVAFVASSIPILAVVLSVIVGTVVVALTLWLFFLIASRFAYVPQVMLVEGQGAFPAIGRSATLASGNVRRLMALFLFSIVATYSALAILFVPLAWYAWANGVEILTFSTGQLPAWYEIANSVIGQVSFILLSPVWTIGLCLLYVDERVRSEGYDIELMAARRLGQIPAVPHAYINPLQPALGSTTVAATVPAAKRREGNLTTLGLE